MLAEGEPLLVGPMVPVDAELAADTLVAFPKIVESDRDVSFVIALWDVLGEDDSDEVRGAVPVVAVLGSDALDTDDVTLAEIDAVDAGEDAEFGAVEVCAACVKQFW